MTDLDTLLPPADLAADLAAAIEAGHVSRRTHAGKPRPRRALGPLSRWRGAPLR